MPSFRILLGLCAVLQVAGAPAPDWRALERAGARIDRIQVEIQDVFDLREPRENTWVGRLGNRLHVETREPVIRRALLFQEGDRVLVRHIRETERRLRNLPFIKDAHVVPERQPDGTVVARVWVRDAWTLMVDVGFQQVGGQRSSSFGVQDQNFLGTGKTVGFSFDREPARTTGTVKYLDPQLLGSGWSLGAQYQEKSDGTGRALDLKRPFYSLDTPWSASAHVESVGSTLTLYDRSRDVYQMTSQVSDLELGFAWTAHRSMRQAWRPGVALVHHEARYGPVTAVTDPGTLPPPAGGELRLRGPALTLAFLDDSYGTFVDMAGMDTPEDYNLGWAGSLMAGTFLPGLNSTERALFARSQASKAWSDSDDRLLLFQGTFAGRRGPAGWADTRAGATLVGYWKATPHRITAAYLGVAMARRPDPENVLYLGANEGLRGYPNHIHPGDASWVLSLSQRQLTEYRWLGILRLGFTAFADAGAIRRMDGTGWSRVYTDVGAGLRLGDLKSSLARVVLITVAAPLVREPGQNKWQLLFGNTITF